MKILHVYKTFYPDSLGGCEQVIDTLTHYGARFNQKHRLVTTGAENRFQQWPHMDVYCYQKQMTIASCPFSYGFFKDFHQQIRWADIIHLHFPWPFADLTACLHRIDKPMVVTYHSDIIKQRYLKHFYTPVMQRFLKKVTIVCPTSENLMHSSAVLRNYLQKCYPISLGLNESNYVMEDKNILCHLPKKILDNYMLFIGVLRYYKGLDVLLDAAQYTNIPIVIVGNGPEKQRLIKIACEKNLENIFFLGAVNNYQKNTLLRNCLSVVLPSTHRSEAFGLSLLEGAISAKSLISTELGTGTSFINRQDETGFVVLPKNTGQLREAMLSLYHNRTLAAAMGQRARQRYLTYFTAEAMFHAYRAVYENLLAV